MDFSKLSSDFAKTVGAQVTKATEVPNIEALPTGLPSFDDFLLSVGGMPRGRVIEGHGAESSGKSTFAHIVSAAGTKQDPNFTTYWDDAEGVFDPEWATKFGQDLENTYIPRDLYSAEDHTTGLKWAIVQGFDLIVLDSIPCLIPAQWTEEDNKANKMQGSRRLKMNEQLARAKYFSQVLVPALQEGFKWEGKWHRLKDSNAVVYFINQIRSNPDAYADADATLGGHALRHLYSARLQFKKRGLSEEVNEYGDSKYQLLQIWVAKSKIGTPFRSSTFMLDFEEGGFLEMADSLINMAKRKGTLKLKGSYYYVDGRKAPLQGKEKAVEYLRDHPELVSSFEEARDDKITVDGKTAPSMSDGVKALLRKKGSKDE